MNYITVGKENSTSIKLYFKEWGSGQPVVFCHGWPLSADAWEDQMFFLGSRGYRCIAHDRRGHGRSSQPWDGNDMDTYSDDLAILIEDLALKNVILVGHSTGGGEVARYIGRHEGCGEITDWLQSRFLAEQAIKNHAKEKTQMSDNSKNEDRDKRRIFMMNLTS